MAPITPVTPITPIIPITPKTPHIVTTPVWTNSAPVPVAAVSRPNTSNTSPTLSTASANSSVRFILPAEHQRKDINISASLSSTCARVMKDTETSIEVSVSGQSRAISFVFNGKPANIKTAKRQLWSLLAQNVRSIHTSLI